MAPPSVFEEHLDSEPLWVIHAPKHPDTGASAIGAAAVVGVVFGMLCAAGHLLLTYNSLHVATFWAADGVLTAYLLLRPRSRWWMPVLAAGLGNGISARLLGSSFWMSGSLTLCHLTEVLVAALLLSRALESKRNRHRDLASPAIMMQFLLFAVLLAPAASALLGAAVYHWTFGIAFWPVVAKWFPPHALGMAVMTPWALVVRDLDWRKMLDRKRMLRNLGMFLLILVVTIVIFQQTHYSLRFLWLPLLMLVVFEVGIVGAILATFEVLIVATLYTLHGHGPFWMEKGANIQDSVLLLQAAILVLLVSIVPFAAMLERQEHLRNRLRQGMQRYRLLADNSRDIVVLSTLEGNRLYVSPAVQDVLGWSQEEWTDQNSADLMHPEDIGPYRRMLREMLHGEDRRIFRYRTRHKDGRYLWMEASLRSLPSETSGEPANFVANCRDISQRVEAEQKVEAAYQQMQQQAQRDSLTGLANRRRFDDGLQLEWRRGRRTGKHLAMLMVDIDHFKRINDTFGHRAGDHCLQALAATLRQIARRPGDMVARYGGEEFVVMLPDVDLAGAMLMAERLRATVREQRIQAGIGHALSLTISVGVAAHIPDKNVRADILVEAADRALYAAKQAGRDRVMPEYDREEVCADFSHHVQ